MLSLAGISKRYGSQVVFDAVSWAVPDGARVLAPEAEFTSLIFPFLAQSGRGVEVAFAPLEHALDTARTRAKGPSRSSSQSPVAVSGWESMSTSAARSVGRRPTWSDTDPARTSDASRASA